MSNLESITQIPHEEINFAQQYYNYGMEQLDRIAYGEHDAKKLILIGFVARGAVLLSGVPGGAKSLLTNHAERIFSDITPEEVAIVPVDAELRPMQLVGGEMNVTREVHPDEGHGKTYSERLVTKVPGIINEHTKVVKVDEATRTNPYALNATLSIPEEKRLVTTAGTVLMPNFQVMISNLNPSETKEATFKLPTAYGSRQLGGAIMGRDVTTAHKQQMMQQQFPNPESVQPFTKTEELNIIRGTVDKVLLPENLLHYGVRIVEAAKQDLKDRFNIVEENRPFIQLGHLTKILALFGGTNPSQENMNEALKYVLAARIGALVAQKDTAKALDETLDSALGRS